jgi:hypothetical protein
MIEQNLNLPSVLKEQVKNFIEALKLQTKENLQSVVLYGGYAKNDFTVGKSNVNMLMVFEQVNMDVLNSISIVIQKAIAEFRLSPFILTSSEIEPSSDVFAVKLFDIQKHHFVLYGTDPLTTLSFDKKNLQFISEQEIRNQLSRMKFFYIQNFNVPEALLRKVQSGITTLLVNANVLLFLKHNKYYLTRTEISEQLLQEPEMSREALEKLVLIKNQSTTTTIEQINDAYDLLMIEFKQLIKAFKKL